MSDRALHARVGRGREVEQQDKAALWLRCAKGSARGAPAKKTLASDRLLLGSLGTRDPVAGLEWYASGQVQLLLLVL